MDHLKGRQTPDLDTVEGFEAQLELLVRDQVDVNTFNANYQRNNLAPYHRELTRISDAIADLHESNIIKQRLSKTGLDSEAWELIVKEIVAIRYTMGLEKRLPTDVDTAWRQLKAIYDALERLLVVVKLYRSIPAEAIARVPATKITRGGIAGILNFRSLH